MRIPFGIKTQVLLITFVPVIVISVFLGGYFTRNLLTNMEHSLWQNGVATALELAFSAEQGVYYENPNVLKLVTDRAVAREDIHAAAIFNKDHVLIAYSGAPLELPSEEVLFSLIGSFLTTATDRGIRFIAPITLQDVVLNDKEDGAWENTLHSTSTMKQTIGWVCVEVERSIITEKKYRVIKTSFFIVLLGLLISTLFAIRLGRSVTEPISNLAQALHRIAQGSLSTRVKVTAHAELKMLQSGVNKMAEALEKNHEKMQLNIAQATEELRNTLRTVAIQNAELDTARNEALTASQIKSDFLANMSHEIRTPMNGILGFISLLLETPLNSIQKNYLQIVNQSANSLLKLLNDILDFSKLEAGKIDLECIPFILRDWIEEALLILSANAQSKGLEIISLIYSDVPTLLQGDPFRIKQVITNLISNAIKFTEKGSITLRCMLEDETETDLFLRFSITDTGTGLNPEQQQKLFSAFNQADASISRRHGGTGLGLAICKKIVAQMGGEIGVESQKGMGSTFWFTCKVEKIKADDNVLSSHTLEGKTVLLFESRPLQRLALKHWLTSWNAQVIILENFADLNDTLLQKYFVDAFILSCYYDPASETMIQAYVQTANQYLPEKIMVLIHHSNQVFNNQLLSAGAQHCLTQPFSHKKLFMSLYEMLFSKKTQAGTKPFSKPLSVLITDDNVTNIKLLAAFLADLNIHIKTAENGYAAIELARHEKFDLIFMDIQMPELDGIATAQKIKDVCRLNQNTPIIAITAHVFSSSENPLEKSCINDYLRKPITQQQLYEAIEKWAVSEEAAPAPIALPRSSAIDWPLALKLVGNKENLAREMLQGLIDTLPTEKAAIVKAYEAEDIPALKSMLHRLHGGCCYCGVPELKAATQHFEMILKDTASLDQMAYQRLLKAIEELLAEMETC